MPKGIGTYGSKRGRPPKMSTKKAMKKMGTKKKKRKRKNDQFVVKPIRVCRWIYA